MINFKTISGFTLGVLILLICLYFIFNIHFYWLILPVFFWIIITLIGSVLIRWNFHLKAFNSKPKCSSKKIAITFDDGPHPENTLKILELLKKNNAKATFFCIGKHVKSLPEILQNIHDEGHSVGNHTYSHHNFIDFNSTLKWVEEIEHTDTLIEKITSIKTTYFRPPYGVTTPHLAKAINKTGHKVIGWNKRSFDTILTNKHTIINRLTKNLKPGDVILLHDTQHLSLQVLEHLLHYLSEHNFEAVTIDALYTEN